MQHERIHRATSLDGTEIAARVHGEGPPLVLIHGAFANGETSWINLLPELTDHFSCETMSTRGRGLSADATDLRPERLIQDVVSIVESIGEPAPVMGLSGGALLALGAAEATDAISAVIAYEPPVFQVLDDDDVGAMMTTVARVAELADEGRPDEGVRTFLGVVANDEEMAAAEELEMFELLAPNVEIQLGDFEAMSGDGPPAATDPDQLAKIEAPVLLLEGTRSDSIFRFHDGIRHVAEHVPQAQVEAIEGAGHLGPIMHPAAVARAMETFLTPVGHRA
jgi:pimeloyl-ACP methyl ester carboxylesterase